MAWGKSKVENLGVDDTHIDIATLSDSTVESGQYELSLPIEAILPASDFNKAGVVTLDVTRKVRAFIGDDRQPVDFTVKLYVQRTPMSDEETEKVNGIAAERKLSAAEKAEKAQRERESAISAAVKMTREIIYDDLANVDRLSRVVSQLKDNVGRR